MIRVRRLKVKRKEEKKKKGKVIKLLLALFLVIVVGVTSTGTYAYFTVEEKILPVPSGVTPVYNDFTINYTDHTQNEVVKDGVTIYFDVSVYAGLLTATANWESNSIIYLDFTGGSRLNTGWNSTTMNLKFDSFSTINPTDLTKCKTTTWNGIEKFNYDAPLGGITWSGCWVKYTIPNSTFDLRTGETARRIIIHRSNSINDQTANNMEISEGVKEVYIRAEARDAQYGGENAYYEWQKLEISY